MGSRGDKEGRTASGSRGCALCFWGRARVEACPRRRRQRRGRSCQPSWRWRWLSTRTGGSGRDCRSVSECREAAGSLGGVRTSVNGDDVLEVCHRGYRDGEGKRGRTFAAGRAAAAALLVGEHVVLLGLRAGLLSSDGLGGGLGLLGRGCGGLGELLRSGGRGHVSVSMGTGVGAGGREVRLTARRGGRIRAF